MTRENEILISVRTVTSHADVLGLVTRSSPRGEERVGGYRIRDPLFFFPLVNRAREPPRTLYDAL